MESAAHEFPSSVDSTHELLAAWKISDDASRANCTSSRRMSEPCTDPKEIGFCQPPAQARSPEPGLSHAADFELMGSTKERTAPPDLVATIDKGRARGPRASDARPNGAPGASGQRPRETLPKIGDELSGFRILLELGRGAFARVYLAEEMNLGQRLVAIKVSRPDGDEPRILARLQHAHIVPVHSVCDDPATGLRVLCMPYFGGADLAHVLKTAGGLVPTRHDGGSLVEALDQVSRQRPEHSREPLSNRPLHQDRSSDAGTPSALALAPVSITRDSRGGTKASRFRGLVFQWLGVELASAVQGIEPGRKQEEPSRQFLREASAIEAAVWIVARLAEGLEHAHARGLLHRDLKPSNVLLAADGTPMLLDFNLAVENQVGSPEGEIHRAMIGGTLPYMSPEHLDAFKSNDLISVAMVDTRSDIYALGLIFFELLAGGPAFPDPPPGIPFLRVLELMIAARRQPPSLRARCRQVPWSLDALAAMCIAHDPSRRYKSARDLAEDLRRFLENLPMKHCPEPSPRERMSKWARRHPGLCGSTSIALFAALLLAMLSGTFAVVYDKMQGLAARVRYRVFDRDFAEIQFLLNTADSSNEHLKRGIEKAARTIGKVNFETTARASSSDWARRLPPEERRRFQEQVVEIVMLDARACVSLARQLGTEHDVRQAIERAIRSLNQAEGMGPRAPSALYTERARYQVAVGDVEQARRDLERSRAVPATTCHDLTLQATALLSAGDRAGAEIALRHALDKDVTSFWAWFVLGHCHFAQGRYLESAGDFAACAVRGPTFAWVHFNRGLALARAGRPVEAKLAYDRALELDATFSEALVNRAIAELELDQVSEAEHDVVRAINLGRDDLVALTSLGEAWARQDRRAEAERFFADLLDRNPDAVVVRVARGFTRINSLPEGARADLTWALEQNPRHPHAHYGMALLTRGSDLKAALDHLDRALASDRNLIDAVQLRALVRARLGEPAALDDVERLLESPTPYHLYNAACAVAVYSEMARVPRHLAHAMALLARAIEAGYPRSDAARDPDLNALHSFPQFDRLVPRQISN